MKRNIMFAQTAALVVLSMSIMISTTACYDVYSEEDNESRTTKSSVRKTEEPDETDAIMAAIADERLYADFLIACEAVEINFLQIVDFKQVEDWAGGTRFSFSYLGMEFRVYCNMDSTVETIKLGASTDVYARGYEPYRVSDYVVDVDTANALIVASEETVKEALVYPDTATFSLLDWAVGRMDNYYTLSSKVTASNLLGEDVESPFNIKYEVDGDRLRVLYFELDGLVIINNMDTIEVSERKIIDDEASETTIETPGEETKVITLTEGELGEFGRTITLDGEDYIEYHVPEGTYVIVNKVKICTVFLAKNEYYKNSDGYMENEIVQTIQFAEYGESETIIISSGEHIELSVPASIELTPIT